MIHFFICIGSSWGVGVENYINRFIETMERKYGHINIYPFICKSADVKRINDKLESIRNWKGIRIVEMMTGTIEGPYICGYIHIEAEKI